jgi:tetrahydromethanopterin S-methyltransferase subunit F
LLLALLAALCLFGIGYFPAAGHDASNGPKSLAYGLALALLLMVPSYFVVRWAMGKSQRIFLITFAAGYLLRLVLLVVLVILYWLYIKESDFCFALAFGTGYVVLSGLEILSFKSAFSQKRDTESSS